MPGPIVFDGRPRATAPSPPPHAQLTRLPASSRPIDDGGRRLVLITTCATGVVEFDDYFHEYRPDPAALRRVSDGLVPLLLAHAGAVADGAWPIEDQIGAVREARFSAGGTIEMLAEFGSNPRSDWIWRDLLAGFNFGASMGLGVLVQERVPAPTLPKPYSILHAWTLREVTICPASAARDPSARVSRPSGLDDLLVVMRAVREAREAAVRSALPDCYAIPLRERLPALVDAVVRSSTGADAGAIAAALRQGIEDFIAEAGALA